MNARQGVLFEASPPLPEGMSYSEGFLSPAEERELLDAFVPLPFEEARYKEYTAKRRIVSYGSQYDFASNERKPAPELPPFLGPLRDKAGRWAGIPAQRFVHALLSEYRPGTALGWHRDVPDFEVIVGISLGGSCRMRFRPFPPRPGRRPGKPSSFELQLEPRSAYLLCGPARWAWQHSIPPAKTLRYSITFRTLRAAAG